MNAFTTDDAVLQIPEAILEQNEQLGQSLGQHLKKIGIAGFDVPGQQDFWVDIAGIVRSIERAAGAQGGIAGQGARLFAERAGDLRDLLFEVRPGKEGVDADLWLRFLPPKKSATK